MSADKSEHSDKEIYFPSELSYMYAQLLQLPTHFGNTERKSTLFTDEEVHNVIRSHQENLMLI